MTRWRGQGRAAAAGTRVATILAAVAVGLGPAWFTAGVAAPMQPGVLDAAEAMWGTERYCTGYEKTFHGAWGLKSDAAGPPVLFRIGASADGAGCYAQLNVVTPPGIAPYELPRFGANAEARGRLWTLHYRGIVLLVDSERGTAVRRAPGEATRTGVLLPRPPLVGDPSPAPSTRQRERWYGNWRGRFPGLPSSVNLRISGSGADRVQARISMLFMAETFEGRFHGEMLVLRWRNRHVGLSTAHGGEALVYHDYRGRIFRFRRVR